MITKKANIIAITLTILMCVGCISQDNELTKTERGLSVEVIPDNLAISDDTSSFFVRVTNLSNEDIYTIDLAIPYDIAFFNGNDYTLIPRDEIPNFLISPHIITILPGESFETEEQKIKTILDIYSNYTFQPGNYRILFNNEWYGEITLY